MKGKLALLFVASFLMFGCNKLTQKNIIGTWNLTAAKLNGVEVTPLPVTWVVTFNEGNTGTSTINGSSTVMTWILDEGEQKITIPSLVNPSQVYDVLEYKKDMMRVQYVDSGSTYEYTFEKQ